METYGMIFIPAGDFLMGTPEEEAACLAAAHGYHISWFSGEMPWRRVHVPAFYIDTFPVTNADYAAFTAATGYSVPPFWTGGQPPDGRLDHPVTMINRGDARAYAAWAGKRLPTEAEWEKAARGTEGLTFPWGNLFDSTACCWQRPFREGTAPVSAHPAGASPYGVMDMIGNVAEWCDDGPGPNAAYIKGGCFLTQAIVHLRPAARHMSGFVHNPSIFYGFRCVREER